MTPRAGRAPTRYPRPDRRLSHAEQISRLSHSERTRRRSWRLQKLSLFHVKRSQLSRHRQPGARPQASRSAQGRAPRPHAVMWAIPDRLTSHRRPPVPLKANPALRGPIQTSTRDTSISRHSLLLTAGWSYRSGSHRRARRSAALPGFAFGPLHPSARDMMLADNHAQHRCR